MTNDDKIKDKKLHNDINREAAKISALLSGKTETQIQRSARRQMIEQAKFIYYFLGRALEN